MNLDVWFTFLERARGFSMVVAFSMVFIPRVVGPGHDALMLGVLFVAVAPVVELYYHASRQPEVLFEREFRTAVAKPLFERIKSTSWNSSTREQIENYGQVRQLANHCFFLIVVEVVLCGFWFLLYTQW